MNFFKEPCERCGKGFTDCRCLEQISMDELFSMKTQSNTPYDEGYNQAMVHVLEKEFAMQCLSCGKDLKQQIMGKMIHIHLCNLCREIAIFKLNKSLKKKKKRKKKR